MFFKIALILTSPSPAPEVVHHVYKLRSEHWKTHLERPDPSERRLLQTTTPSISATNAIHGSGLAGFRNSFLVYPQRECLRARVGRHLRQYQSLDTENWHHGCGRADQVYNGNASQCGYGGGDGGGGCRLVQGQCSLRTFGSDGGDRNDGGEGLWAL